MMELCKEPPGAASRRTADEKFDPGRVAQRVMTTTLTNWLALLHNAVP